MYLKISNNKKTGRTYLSIASGYRDKVTKKSKTVLIKSLGYLDVLQKDFERMGQSLPRIWFCFS